MPGVDGLRKMAALMDGLRNDPPAQIAGTPVTVRKDYSDGTVIDCATGEKSKMELSGSNVLRFLLADGTTILVRPSGTEPKVKVYILASGDNMDDCKAKTDKYAVWAEGLKK